MSNFQEKIDKAYKIAQKVFEVSIVCLLAFGLMIFTKPLFGMMGCSIETMTYYPAIHKIYKGIIAICGIGALCGVMPTLILSMIATDDEKKQRKEEIKEAVREMNIEDKQLKRRMPQKSAIYSPLVSLSLAQEEHILRLLKRAAKTSDGSNKMNRSEVATLLATLKSLGRLEDAGDYNNLRLWVENVIGLTDDDNIHFNEAYKRAMDKKGDTRYTADLKKILDNID